jgi:NTE family protein
MGAWSECPGASRPRQRPAGLGRAARDRDFRKARGLPATQRDGWLASGSQDPRSRKLSAPGPAPVREAWQAADVRLLSSDDRKSILVEGDKPRSRTEMIETYGVFEGGGVRGIALVGALAAAEARGISFRAVAGTSAGAIVASLIAAGYSASELRQILSAQDFRTFRDGLPGIRYLLAWKRLGFHKGDEFHRWIAEHLSLKLKGRRNESPRFSELKKPLTVIATDVVRQQVKVFSTRRTPDFVVADAVRMSMSIPFFFIPVPLGKELIVDGGVLSNFPAWAFDEERKTAPLPILGIRLQAADLPSPKIRNQLGLAKAIVSTMRRAGNQLQIGHIPGLYVIDVPTFDVKTTDFDISQDRKDELYQAGFHAAQAFLATTELA